MNITGSLGISRGSDDKVRIRVRDEASGSEFLVVELGLEDYALLITGLCGIKASCEVRGLDVVGKEKIRESRQAVCPLASYDRNALEKWLIESCQEEGWIIDSALRSQNSTYRLPEGTGLNYSVYRYEES